MTKVAYNSCYGGFSLSREAVLRGRKLSDNPKWAGCVLKGDPLGDGVWPNDYGQLDYNFGSGTV